MSCFIARTHNKYFFASERGKQKFFFEVTYYLVIKCNFSTQSTCRTNIMHTCGKLINSRHQIMSISDLRASSFQSSGELELQASGGFR